jgi:hypothetical protein
MHRDWSTDVIREGKEGKEMNKILGMLKKLNLNSATVGC